MASIQLAIDARGAKTGAAEFSDATRQVSTEAGSAAKSVDALDQSITKISEASKEASARIRAQTEEVRRLATETRAAASAGGAGGGGGIPPIIGGGSGGLPGFGGGGGLPQIPPLAQAGTASLNELTGAAGLSATALLGIGAAGVGIKLVVDQVSDAVEANSKLSASLVSIAARSSEAASHLADYRIEARALAEKTGRDISEQADLILRATQKGLQDNSALLESAAKSAQAGFASQAGKAFDIGTGILDARGIESTKQAYAALADSVVKVSHATGTNAEQLGGALQSVAAHGSELRTSFDALESATAALAGRTGDYSGSASTVVRIFGELENSGSNLHRTLAGLGLDLGPDAFSDANIVKTLRAMADLAATSKSASDAVKSSGSEGASFLALVAQNSNAIRDAMAAARDSAGSTQAAFDRVVAQPTVAVDRLKQGIKDIRDQAVDSASQSLSKSVLDAFNTIKSGRLPTLDILIGIPKAEIEALGAAISTTKRVLDIDVGPGDQIAAKGQVAGQAAAQAATVAANAIVKANPLQIDVDEESIDRKLREKISKVLAALPAAEVHVGADTTDVQNAIKSLSDSANKPAFGDSDRKAINANLVVLKEYESVARPVAEDEIQLREKVASGYEREALSIEDTRAKLLAKAAAYTAEGYNVQALTDLIERAAAVERERLQLREAAARDTSYVAIAQAKAVELATDAQIAERGRDRLGALRAEIAAINAKADAEHLAESVTAAAQIEAAAGDEKRITLIKQATGLRQEEIDKIAAAAKAEVERAAAEKVFANREAVQSSIAQLQQSTALSLSGQLDADSKLLSIEADRLRVEFNIKGATVDQKAALEDLLRTQQLQLDGRQKLNALYHTSDARDLLQNTQDPIDLISAQLNFQAEVERSKEKIDLLLQDKGSTKSQLDQAIQDIRDHLEKARKEAEKPFEVKALSVDLAGGIANDLQTELLQLNKFRDFALSVAKDIEAAFIKAFVTKPLTEGLTSGFKSLFGASGLNVFGSARGNVFDQGAPVPFALGGLPDFVNQPTKFPLAGGRTGIAGEAGPEAIMPLARDSSGKLGISAPAQSQSQQAIVQHYHNTVNVHVKGTNDASGMRKSGRQVASEVQRVMRRRG